MCQNQILLQLPTHVGFYSGGQNTVCSRKIHIAVQSLENEHEESLTLVAAPELEGSHPDCAAALSRVSASRSLTWRPMRDLESELAV